MRRAFAIAIAGLAAGCDCYSAHREPEPCDPGTTCEDQVFVRCRDDGEVERRDCVAEGLLCDGALGCVECPPGETRCEDSSAERCADDGSGWIVQAECDASAGEVCDAGACALACDVATRDRSSAGCELWAVDLPLGTTAGDTEPFFFVTVVNPGRAVASVEVSMLDGASGASRAILADVAAGGSQRFALDRRPVRGSDGSAVSFAAYRIVSSVPVRATQIGGASGIGPPSPDASMLLPTAALGTRYSVLSWPQTIATPDFPESYATFLTIVGTEANTTVTVTPVASVLATDGIDPVVNEPFAVTLDAYEVLHLETDSLHADLTGTTVEATAPVAVFAGSEASDVPAWDVVSERECCAGHLEEQVPPVDRLGTQYAVPLSAWRAGAVSAAGATVAIVSAPTWVRVLATSEGRTSITTTLPAPWDAFDLPARGFETIQTETDFLLSADQPVAVATFGASQQVTGIPSALPAGAPTFAMVPLPDRFETEVVVAVPEGFPFDFVTILGGEALPLWDRGPFPMDCDSSAIEDDLFVHRCQVSFPEILEDQLDPITGEAPWIQSAVQADGVHGIEAEEPFGIVLEGFGKNAAYALPGS